MKEGADMSDGRFIHPGGVSKFGAHVSGLSYLLVETKSWSIKHANVLLEARLSAQDGARNWRTK